MAHQLLWLTRSYGSPAKTSVLNMCSPIATPQAKTLSSHCSSLFINSLFPYMQLITARLSMLALYRSSSTQLAFGTNCRAGFNPQTERLYAERTGLPVPKAADKEREAEVAQVCCRHGISITLMPACKHDIVRACKCAHACLYARAYVCLPWLRACKLHIVRHTVLC